MKLSKEQREYLAYNYTLRRTYGVQYNDKLTGRRGTRIVCFYVNNETDTTGFPPEREEQVLQGRLNRYLDITRDSYYFGNEWGGGNTDTGIYDAILAINPQPESSHGGRIDIYLTACLVRDFTEEQRLKYAALQRRPDRERAFHIYDNRFDRLRDCQ